MENVNHVNLAWVVEGAKECQKEIDVYYTYLNDYLDEYNQAIKEKNVAKLVFIEDNIRVVRDKLVELEYFASI